MSSKFPKDILLGTSLSNITKLSFSVFKGRKLLDIRKWFQSKDTGDLEPSKKGISLNKDTFVNLYKLLEDKDKSIINWFETSDYQPEKKMMEELIKKSEKIRQEQLKKKEFTIKSGKLNDRSFFKIEANGDKREVFLNENHPFIKENIKNKEVISIISTLALTFQLTLDNYDSSEKISIPDLNDYILEEWGLVLKQYNKKASND
jgi:hypothetical protein